MDCEEATCRRTVEEVRKTLKLAAINELSLHSVSQILYSAKEHDANEHIKLLELDNHLLQLIKKGTCLKFCGSEEESAVLCTESRTYDIKEAETSNSCLLVPKLHLCDRKCLHSDDRIIKTYNISRISHTYYEVKECPPKLEKLLDMLEPTSYKGTEYESMIPQEQLYDWDRLRNEIQASDDKLIKALDEYLICFLNDYFRLVSYEFEVRCLTQMLDCFDENSWEIDEVDKSITYDSLNEIVPIPIFNAVFSKYTSISDKTKKNGTQLYKYNEEQCCKTLAKILLTASPVTEYKQFMESWCIGTPEKMVPKEEYLYGIALIVWNKLTKKKEIVSFAETNLPKNINDRFNELFKAKDKWTVEEITPYIIKLTTSEMNVNALLTKYARCSVINHIKYYSSKYGK